MSYQNNDLFSILLDREINPEYSISQEKRCGLNDAKVAGDPKLQKKGIERSNPVEPLRRGLKDSKK